MTTYFVSRHAGALEWVRRRGYDAVYVAHLDANKVHEGDIVLGTLPVPMIADICAKGARYFHLTLTTPPEMRGKELSVAQMETYGANLAEFTARRIKVMQGEKSQDNSGLFPRVRSFIKVYRWPIFVIIAWVGVAILLFGMDFVWGLYSKLQNIDWWIENTFAVIVFTVAVSWVAWISARHRAQEEKRPFEGWTTLVIKPDGQYESDLQWYEARDILGSVYRERQFIQSVVSSEGGWLKNGKLILNNPENWVFKDEKTNTFVFKVKDFPQK